MSALATSAVALTARPASAHGISGDVAGYGVPDFVPVGIEHMLLGWDHLLFIVSVVLLAGELTRAAKFISLFVVGHSTTLIIATLAEWRVNPRLVDAAIALSIAYVGAVGLRGRPERWTGFAGGVLGFGLVHGLGLSTRFQDLNVQDNEVGKLIAFNIGIEIGQLLAVSAIVLFGKLLLSFLPDPSVVAQPEVQRRAYFGLIAVGVVAGMVLVATRGGEDPYEQIAADSPADCQLDTGQAPLVYEGNHPPRSFFAPGESYNEADFGHIVGDGYIVIRYPDSLPKAQWEGLRQLVADNPGAVAGSIPAASGTIQATTQDRVLTCQALDLDTLTRFTDTWLRESD